MLDEICPDLVCPVIGHDCLGCDDGTSEEHAKFLEGSLGHGDVWRWKGVIEAHSLEAKVTSNADKVTTVDEHGNKEQSTMLDELFDELVSDLVLHLKMGCSTYEKLEGSFGLGLIGVGNSKLANP